MDSSFFEYRDKTGVDSDSGSEIIDNSLVIEESFSAKKIPVSAKKNQTVFVAESDEYSTDEDEQNEPQKPTKTVLRRSSAVRAHIISSSDDDSSKQGSIRRTEASFNNVVLSSSDEDEPSPELLPKRRPPLRQTKSTDSSSSPVLVRKKNKRMILVDSDTENSIVMEHKKHNKLKCLKDTPLKVDDGKFARKSMNVSAMSQSNFTSDSDSSEQNSESDESCDDDEEKRDKCDEDKTDKAKQHCTSQITDDKNDETCMTDDDSQENGSESDGPDEDQMVMSRATRMSIMGVLPEGGDDSDDSDFILSDSKSIGSSVANSLTDIPEAVSNHSQDTETSRISCSPIKSPLHDVTKEKSIGNSVANSLTDLPEAVLNQSQDTETSRISCSPIKSPLNDVTKELNNSINIDSSLKEQSLKFNNTAVKNNLKTKEQGSKFYDDAEVTFVGVEQLNEKSLNDFRKRSVAKENVIDDDITIIDTKPEIIALSSDDDEEKPLKKSPSIKKSSKMKSPPSQRKDPTIKQYLVPPSYPNQGIYVTKQERQNELTKLESLREDMQNVKKFLETIELQTLPDGGVKLIERLSALEAHVRKQGDKVASMIVEPENPTALDMMNDGFGRKTVKAPSWDELQKASNAVQPRMFGKQAMATHMAERNLILDRLKDLHESLASCPSEDQTASAPPALRSELLRHQARALAWLRWRETQRPSGGILADDMGLGKTITMISLIVSDKENTLTHDDDEYSGSKLTRGGNLVVCPASLVQQWADEVNKHCKAHTLSICLHHGPNRATQPHRLATYDLVLTTYNILQRDNEKNGVLMRVQWRRVILDEAHTVRNHKSATSLAVAALPARRRWALTGTPVHNKDLDLFALLKFLRCTPFDDLTMWKKWIDNKSMGGQERLNTIMQCILLRRTKLQLQRRGQLQCLPAKTAHQLPVTLDKEEMNVYQKVLVFSKTLFAQFLHQRAERQGDVAPDKNTAYEEMHKKMVKLQGAKPVKSHEILVLLLRLRQVCCHCALIGSSLEVEGAPARAQDPAEDQLLDELHNLSLVDAPDRRRKSGRKSKDNEQEEEEEGPGEGTSVAEAMRSVLSPHNPVFSLARPSSKIKAVMDCLRKNVFTNEGEKAVVVSQWTSVLSLVEAQLKRDNIRSVTLSGSVPVTARPQLLNKINDANSDVRVMLLSLCAGGVGLNLCGANHLLLLDPHWNPQLEEQAQDRIYRVGQQRDVHIYRFVCVDTVEQSISKLQQSKLQLAENVLTGAKNTNNSKLTIQDLKVLFNMGQ